MALGCSTPCNGRLAGNGRAPVDGRLDALHEDEGGQAARVAQPLGGRRAVQVVATALALRLEHIALRVRLRVRQHLLRGGVLQVVQAPQACSSIQAALSCVSYRENAH